MAFTEAFATTAAQTIPVFAFAATIELRFFLKRLRLPSWDSPAEIRWYKLGEFASHFVGYAIWAGLMVWLGIAEWISLQRLRGMPVSEDSATTVQNALLAAIAVLIVVPALAWPATMLNRLILSASSRVFSVGRDNTPTLDDHPFAMGVTVIADPSHMRSRVTNWVTTGEHPTGR